MLEHTIQLSEDYGALKAWALEQVAALVETRREQEQAQAGLVPASLMIEKLKIELVRLKRESHDASSEKLIRNDQLQLRLEDLKETVAAATPARAEGCFAQAGASLPPITRCAKTSWKSLRLAKAVPSWPPGHASAGSAKTPSRSWISYPPLSASRGTSGPNTPARRVIIEAFAGEI